MLSSIGRPDVRPDARPVNRRRSVAPRDHDTESRPLCRTWCQTRRRSDRTPSRPRPALGLIDRVQVLLRLAVQRGRQLVEHVGRSCGPNSVAAWSSARPRAGPARSRAHHRRWLSSGSSARPFSSWSWSSTSRQHWALSRKPSLIASSSLRPLASAPISTRMHCRSCSSRGVETRRRPRDRRSAGPRG